MKSANEKLRQSAYHKNPVIRYEYNKYMAHHYAYMEKVANFSKLEGYIETLEDAKWQSAIEEEIWALVVNNR